MEVTQTTLPTVLAGPILRQVDATLMTLWVVTSHPCVIDVKLVDSNEGLPVDKTTEPLTVQVGQHCYIHLLSSLPSQSFSENTVYYYDLIFDQETAQNCWDSRKTALLYSAEQLFSFRLKTRLTNVLHGSCRKPHFKGKDAFHRVDELIAQEFTGGDHRPDLMVFTGDQIYADDVAGPTLQAIHQLIGVLGLYDENIDGATIELGSDLFNHHHNFYERERILPQTDANDALSGILFNSKKKPIFTSVHAQNHLITFSEIMAMYLLAWSPTPWSLVNLDASKIPTKFQERFAEEQRTVCCFISDLKTFSRAIAHVPVYMIFDDHDVTDDWNLTIGWEQEVYNHPLSRRMVGNALMAYWLCQGWGNAPHKFRQTYEHAQRVFNQGELVDQDEFIDALFDFEQWHYDLHTQPPLRVLDTRTRRWRSESSLNKPSGLMDWEALCEFQHGIINQDAVIVVSAAPIYGVKFIEAVQKVFTFFGKALTVDAENWMAHKGTANVILNIFRHYKTPPHFYILSGDVHYSFVYDVRLRFRRNSPRIVQFTCSGIKNAFPTKLLRVFETLNRWFYGPKSFLNVFTRRRNMTVTARKPFQDESKELLNKPAVGQLLLNEHGTKVTCRALCNDGETVEFGPANHKNNEK